MNWFAYVLIVIGGFLIGGVISLWRNDSRVASVIVGVLAVMCAVGGVLWLL